MARLSDIIQTGIRKEDLHDEDGNDPPEWVEKLIRIVNTGLRSTYNVLTPGVSQGGVSFGDNFKCNLITAKFSHGVATSLSLGTLMSAKGCLVLGADKGAIVIANKLAGSTQAGQVKLTLWFADPAASNTNVTVLLLPEGTLGTSAPTSTPSRGASAGGTGGSAGLTVAAGSAVWTDIPSATCTYTIGSNVRSVLAQLSFAAYAGGAAGVSQARVVIGSAASTGASFFWNTLAQHQGWFFQFLLPAQTAAIGTQITVKGQVISPGGSPASINMDGNDACSIVAQEVGT